MKPKIYNQSGNVRVSKIRHISGSDVALITWEKHRDDDFAVVSRLVTFRGRPKFNNQGNYFYRRFWVDL